MATASTKAPTTTSVPGRPATEVEISDALAKAEREAQALRARAEVVAEARREARHAALMSVYRDAANGKAVACNRERSAIEARLNQIAGAVELDVAALEQTFIALKMADARCGGNADFAANLDTIDPLPDNAIGAPQTRTRSRQIWHQTKWSDYLDAVIDSRAARERTNYASRLNDAAGITAESAADAAAAEALDLADGQKLDVQAPATIADQYAQAVAQIDDESLDQEQVLAAGQNNVRAAARAAELQRLISEGN